MFTHQNIFLSTGLNIKTSEVSELPHTHTAWLCFIVFSQFKGNFQLNFISTHIHKYHSIEKCIRHKSVKYQSFDNETIKS